MTREQFTAIRHGQAPEGEPLREDWFRTLRHVHVSVSRNGGEAQRFTTGEWTWRDDVHEDERFFSLYVRAEDEWIERLGQLLRGLGRSGFGRRASSGRGAFEVEGEAEPCPWLEPLPFENAFVALNHFVPDDGDPADGWWDTLLKYPKLGSERGASSTPFKGRLLMLTPGTCLRPSGRPRRWYGRMIAGLSPAFPDALHYGLCYAVGIRWDK